MKSSERERQTLTDKQIRARSGEILGRNLKKHGEPEPPDHAAHHIIPLADNRIQAASDVRALFERFFPPEDYQHLPLEEWPINQHFNGVWMRHRNLHNLEKKEIPHTITHDEDYYNELYEQLAYVESKEEFLEELSHIKEKIQQNRFWDHDPEKLVEIESYRQEKIKEQQILDRFEDEFSIPSDEKKALTNKWTSKEEKAAMSDVESKFSDILDSYEEAKEQGNSTQFDQHLLEGFPSTENTSSEESRKSVIETLKGIINKQGFIPYESSVTPSDFEFIKKAARLQTKQRIQAKLQKTKNQDSDSDFKDIQNEQTHEREK